MCVLCFLRLPVRFIVRRDNSLDKYSTSRAIHTHGHGLVLVLVFLDRLCMYPLPLAGTVLNIEMNRVELELRGVEHGVPRLSLSSLSQPVVWLDHDLASEYTLGVSLTRATSHFVG